MKKTIMLLLAAAVSVTVTSYAQNVKGSFACLKGEQRVRMIIDFSEADIMGMTEDEFYGYEEEWIEDKQWVVNHYYDYANRQLGKRMMLGNYKKSKYTLILVVRYIDLKGNQDCDLYLFEDKENGEKVKLAEVNRIYGKGGRVGDNVGLIKDGAESIGKYIGILLRKEVFGHKWVGDDYPF